MFSFRFPAAAAGLALLSLGAWAQPRANVFVLPQAGQGNNISVFSANPFAPVTTFATVNNPAFLFLRPDGARVIVLASSGEVSVHDTTPAFNQVALYSLSAQIRGATLTPDGRKLLVLTTSLRIIDLAVDRPDVVPTVDVGTLPTDVAVSLDSSRAYVISGISRTIVAVDLANNQRIGQQGIPGTPGGIAVGPNGLIYVTTSNALFELDWRDGFHITIPGGVSLTGEPGKPAFTPDGRYVIFATRPNDAPSTVFEFDVRNRTLISAAGPPNLDNLTIADNARAFALAGGNAFVIQIGTLQPPAPASIGAFPGTRSLTISDEAPEGRFLYGQTTNTLFRVELRTGQFVGPLSTIGSAESAQFRATPSAGVVAGLQRTASRAPVFLGDVSFPIAVRAVDASGRPVPNALVEYTTTGGGVVLPVTSARTNNNGLAAVVATMPSAAGTFAIRASTAGAFVDIPIEVTSRPTTERRFTIFSGQGQVVIGASTSVLYQVRLRDDTGAPVPGQTVNWAVLSGVGVTAITPTSTTDSAGIALGVFATSNFTPTPAEQFRPFTVQAAVSAGTLETTLNLQGVVLPSGGGINVQLTTSLVATDGVFLLPAGGVINGAFQALVLTEPPLGSGLVPVPVPNVGIQASMADLSALQVSCADDPVTSAAGAVTCNLAAGAELGQGTMNIVVGGLPSRTYPYAIRVIPGAPSSLTIVQGNGQSGSAGQVTPLALVVEVRDAAGNPLRGVEMGWQILSGSGELVGPRLTTDNNGRASTQVRFGAIPGTVTVQARTGALSINFTLTNNTVGDVSLTIQSGSGQTALIGTPFAAPLVVRVATGGGAPLAGIVVNFAGNGPINLNASSATTNAQGLASITVNAGAAAGAATVSASAAGQTVVFNLTVVPPGPRIDSLLNGASFQPGVSPCAVGVIRGRFGIPANTILSSSVGAVPLLAFTLAGVSVQIGGQAAPIYYVSNIGGEEQVGIQIPCEQPAGPNELRVTAQGASSTLPVTLADVAPGIFETQFVPGVSQGVALRPNGSYVSPGNPALHNETITGYFTGLGSTLGGRGTNVPGVGQELPVDRLIVGVNNQGMPVVSAAYAPNLIGVWVVSFRITAEAGQGDRQAYAVGVRNAQGAIVYGQPSALPVRER
jgi:uncharacterized protein (TIGR03437 family)